MSSPDITAAAAPKRTKPTRAHHPLIELTLARFREFLREPEAVFWVFAFPVIMTCALGIAFRSRGEEPIIVGIVEQAGADMNRIAAFAERDVHRQHGSPLSSPRRPAPAAPRREAGPAWRAA